MLNLILRPLQAPAVWLLVAWTLVGPCLVLMIDSFVDYAPIATALAIGFLLPVWYVLMGGLSTYAQKHLVHAARGLGDEPIAATTDFNPLQDALAFQLALLLLIPLYVVAAFGPDLTVAQVILPVLVFPLLWLGVMLEGSLLAGLHPAMLWRILAGLNIAYVPTALIVSACVGSLVYTIVYWHHVLAFAAVGYGYLLGHGVVGKILYWRRGPLHLHTDRSPEQARARELQERHAALNRLLNELHRLCSTGRVLEAYDKLDAHMDGAYEDMDPLIHERLLAFQDKRLTLEHAVHYLGRLLEAGKRVKAWALFKSCLALDDRFRPMEDHALIELTRAASRADALLVEELLGDFPRAYPHSNLIAAAKFRRARVLLELIGNTETAHGIVREIAQSHPEFAAEARYRNYRAKHHID